MDIENIEWKSQLGQDHFVASATAFKRNGTFADIGAGHPTEISNTFALERHLGWSGILCDIEHAPALMSRASQNIVVADARTTDWGELFARIAVDGWIDFLSLDLEPPDLTLEVLKKLPLDRFRFRVAVVEHDMYREGGHRRAAEMSAIMYRNGYEFAGTAGMVMDDGTRIDIEDWWIHRESGLEIPR